MVSLNDCNRRKTRLVQAESQAASACK
jgi:hypothetical protein